MSNGLAFVLLFLLAGSYTARQWVVLKRLVRDKPSGSEWFDGVFLTGAIMSLAMVMNAVPFLKSIAIEHEFGMSGEMMMGDGTMGRVDPPGIFWSQVEVLAGTLSLIAIVWSVIHRQGEEQISRGRRGQLEVIAAVSRRLLVPFWLAAFGMGSVFGVSAGFGLTGVLSHIELLFGPPLLLAAELTFMWLGARFMLRFVEGQAVE